MPSGITFGWILPGAAKRLPPPPDSQLTIWHIPLQQAPAAMSRHPLPVEVWDNVCHLLNNSDLKSLRGTCALVEKEVSRHLVHTIKIYTNSAGLDRLAGLSRERRLRKHVKAIQFDLAPPRSIWHSENPWLVREDFSTVFPTLIVSRTMLQRLRLLRAMTTTLVAIRPTPRPLTVSITIP